MKPFPTEYAPKQEVELLNYTSISFLEKAHRKQIVSAMLLVIVIFQFVELPGALMMQTAIDIGTVFLLLRSSLALSFKLERYRSARPSLLLSLMRNAAVVMKRSGFTLIRCNLWHTVPARVWDIVEAHDQKCIA